MAMITVWLKIDEERVVEGLKEAGKTLDSAEREVVVEFTAVRRVDPGALRAMEEFASMADAKGVKVILRGVNVDVYKVLTLVNLVSKFSFVS